MRIRLLSAPRSALLCLALTLPLSAAPVAVNDAYSLDEDTVYTAGLPIVSGTFNAGTSEGFTYADDAFGTNSPNNSAGSVNANRGVGGTGCLLVDTGRRPPQPRSSSGAWSRTFNLSSAATVEVSVSFRLQTTNTEFTFFVSRYAEAIFTMDGTRYGNGTSSSLTRLVVPNGGGNQDSGWLTQQFSIPLAAGNHTMLLGAYCNSTGNPHFAEALFDNVTVRVGNGNGTLSNDTGGTGTVTATRLTNPSNGTLVFNTDGTFSYTPAANWNGTDSFTYRASDSTGNSNTATVTLTVNPVNDAPVGTGETYAATEDTPLTVDAPGLLANDSDVDNTAGQLSALVATQPANGAVSISADGGFTYTPTLNFAGTDTFTYRATDGAANSSPVTVTMNVANAPDAPLPVTDHYRMAGGGTLTVSAATHSGAGTARTYITAAPETSSGSTAQPGDTWKYLDDGSNQGTAWRQPAFNDAAWKSGQGELGYGDDAGEDRPEFTVIGFGPNSSSKYITTYFRKSFTVDDWRKVSAMTMSLLRDDGVVVWLNGNRIYFENGLDDALYDTPTAGSSPNEATHQTIALPEAAQYLVDGVNVLAVELHQSDPGTSDASFDMGVTATERPYAGVLANDVEPDGQPMTAALASQPAHGSVVFNASGTFTYTPTAGYTGEDSFTYTVTDGALISPPATVNISIIVPGLPVAAADSYATTVGTPLTVSATSPGGAVTRTLITAAPETTNGVAQPGDIWKFLDNGTDQGTAWREIVFDDSTWSQGAGELGYGDNTTTDQRPEITVISYGPNASSKYITTYFRKAFSIADRTRLSGLSMSLLRDDGTVAYLNGNRIHVDTGALATAVNNGSLSYTTLADNTANEATHDTFALASASQFLTDGLNVVAVEVHQNTVGSSDLSFDLGLTAQETPYTGVLHNDSDPDGEPITAVLFSQAGNGSVVLNANGTFTYTPNAGFRGADSFTYRASDGNGLSPVATVTINVVGGANQKPIANADAFAATEDVTLTRNAAQGVLANDTDPDDDPMTAVLVNTTANGVLVFNADGSFSYTPQVNWSGTDTFTYRARDSSAQFSTTATVTLNVAAANDAPVAAADSYGTNPGSTLTVTAAQGVLSNDSDIEDDPLTAQIVAAPASGSFSLLADGGFTFTPAASGVFTFTYRAFDGSLASSDTTVTIVVNGQPIAVADSFSTIEDGPIVRNAAGGVLSNDSDPENSPLTATVTVQPQRGTLVLGADGSFTYTPQANYSGSDSFTYTVSDGSRTSLPAVVSISITPENDAPVAVADSYGVLAGQTLNIAAARGVLSNDKDVEASALSVVQQTEPQFGTLTLSANGSFTYVPGPEFTTGDFFTYRISDGSLTSSAATVDLFLDEPGDSIVINEIMYHPGTGYPENTAREWIELYNRGANTVNLAGWTISAGVTYTFPAGTTMVPGSYLVVAANISAFQTANPGVTNVIGGWAGSLSNGGEKIELSDAAGKAWDKVSHANEGDWASRIRETTFGGWTWSTTADSSGRSLELRNPDLSNDNGQNWSVSTGVRGSPGAANAALTANIAPVIKAVQHSPAVPLSSDRVLISCELNDESAPAALAVILYWRDATTTSPGAFQPLAMSHDGNGGWFAKLEPQPNLSIVEFYISASDGTNSRTWPAPTSEGQNANCQYQVSDETPSATAETYRITMTAAENAAYNTVSSSSDRNFNQTLIITRGQESTIRYRCDMRIRGNSSRSYQFKPLRIGIPSDDDLNGITGFSLNPKAPHLQHLGMRLLQVGGVAASDSLPVELRRNGVESTTSIGNTPDYGMWVRVETEGSGYVGNHWPEASGGGLYTKRSPERYWRSSGWSVPSTPDGLLDNWTKQNNSGANDWSDLTSFFTVAQSTAAPHFPGAPATDVSQSNGGRLEGPGAWDGTALSAGEYAQLSTVADLDQWARFFAIMTVLQDYETNISNGVDDDYGIYFVPGTDGNRRAQFVPHDLDTIFGLGDAQPAFNATGIYDMTEGGQSNQAFRTLLPLIGHSTAAGNATFTAKYHGALRELLGTVFDADTTANPNPPFYQFVDYHLGNWAPAGTRTAIKDFVRQRRAYLLGLLGGSATTPSAPTSNAIVTSAHGTLFISEILANNVSALNNGGTFPDAIELHNTGATAVTLTGMSLTDDPLVKAKFVFPAGAFISPGARLVVYADTATTPGLHTGFGLSADGDAVYLYDTTTAGQTLLDSITFGLQPADFSIGRTGAALDTWTLCTPTPSAANVAVGSLASSSGIRINEWLGNADYRAATDFIELYNPGAQPSALGGMSLTDDFINYPARHVIPPLSFIAGGGFIAFEAKGSGASPGNAREMAFSLDSTLGHVALLGANGTIADRGDTLPQFRDVSTGRVTDGTGVFTTLATPSPGYSNAPLAANSVNLLNSLRITELMYNPAGAAQSEYIEFRNTSTTATLDLSGVAFANGITYTFPAGTSLAPGAFLVLAGEPAKFTAQFPSVPVTGPYTGRLDNGGERIRFDLPGQDIAILDFTYADGWHPSTDGGGDALQIVNALASPAMWDRSEGWQASPPNPGSLPPFSVYAGQDFATPPAVPVFLNGNLRPGSFAANAITLQWSKDSGPGTVTFTTAACEDANATFSAPGIYVLRFTASAPGPVSVSDQITIAVTETYEAWAVRTLGSATSANRLPSADPDKDGLSNFAEYVLAGNPDASDAAPLTTVQALNGSLALDYRRSLTADSAITIVPEVSTDTATGWTDASPLVQQTLLAESSGVQTWRLTLTEPFTTTPRRFLRLRIAAP